MYNNFDTYQAEIEYRSNKIRKEHRPQPPPRPDPVRTPARGGHPHRQLTRVDGLATSVDTAAANRRRDDN